MRATHLSAAASLMALAAVLGLAGCGATGASKLTSQASCQAGSSVYLGKAEVSFAAGHRLSVVVRDACSAPGPIVSQIPDRYEGVTKAGVRAYPWVLEQSRTAAEIRELAAADPCVAGIEDDVRVTPSDDSAGESAGADPDDAVAMAALPSDPGVSRERHLQAIGADEAYETFYDPVNGITKSVVIAIIDSGVALTHEDLAANIWTNPGEIPGNGIDDDHNGYVDDVHGYNFASRIASPEPQKTTANASWQWAHGTRVAGLAAAVADNGKGVAGVAGHAKIMALNNMGKAASMDQADTANAIRYAADNGADVINLSLGGGSAGTDYRNALRYAVSKGVVVLAAAGNENSRIDSSYSAAGQASALKGLISIGNFQASTFQRSTTSNYSPTYVELGAPGTYTMSTLLFTTSPQWSSSYGYYSYFSGTSAAVPVASGAAALAVALLKSRGYQPTAAEIEDLLLTSAAKKSTLTSYFKSGNALDLAALAKLIDSIYAPDGTPLTPRPGAGDESSQGADPSDECTGG